MKALEDVLAESREYIEEHGWIRGEVSDDDGHVCALGGIGSSQGWVGVNTAGKRVITHVRSVETVASAVIDALDLNWEISPLRSAMLAHWNDFFASDQQQVLDAFAKAEKIARAGHDPDAS